MEQQQIQHLVPEQNGKYPQPLLPVYAPPLQENKTDEWDLRQILTVARRRAVLIGSVAIAVSATVWFWTLSRQPKYEGKFRLLVEPVAAQSKLAGMYENPGASANPQEEILDYNTQILVLQSPEIIAPILKQISSRYPDISYPSLVENLKISRLQETKILEVSYQDAEPQKIQFSLQQLAKAYLKYSLQQRQVNLGQGIQFVDSEMPKLRMRVNSLQTQLQRFRQHYNFIDPEAKAERLSSQVSNIQFQRLDTQKQLAETRRLYAILQGKSGTELAQSSALGATSPGQSGTDLAQSGAFDAILQGKSGTEVAQSGGLGATSPGQSGTQSAETPAFDRASQSRSDAQLAKTHDGSSQGRSGAAQAQNEGSVYQGLVARLRDLDGQIATELSRYREGSPAIQVLRLKRKNLLPVLQEEAKRVLGIKLVEVANQISGLEVRSAKIAQAESSLNQQIKQLPNLARQYTDLQRELKVATQSLNQFLEKRESLQIENAQKQIPWQLLSSPELPQIPFSPNVQRNLILGVITGLLAGMAAALCVERLDNVFHSPDDIKELTKLPLLGMIPFHKNLKDITPVTKTDVGTQTDDGNLVFRNITNAQGYSYFPFLEAFRSLYTNIGFLGSDTPIHSLVVSSAVRAEGKSTVSLNLAHAAAAMGQRVLLVDADLRLPQMHTLLGLPNEQGLSNVISTNLPVLEVIQRSPLWDNLFVLTSGQIPPDPTKLLSSKKMQNIMAQLRQNFDLVIYDTPPFLGLADSSLLATYTAGIVLVVRMGKTDRSILKQALDRLKLSRAAVLGTVCNGIKNSNQETYNYYYRPRTQSSGVN